MAHLTPFLKEKYTYLFQQFYDTNKNGVITHSDFVETAAALKDMRGWGPNDTRLHHCEEMLNQAWVALKHGADADQDQKVTLDEWHQYWAKFVSKTNNGTQWPAEIPWIQKYTEFWFDLMDTSGDGVIDEHEYEQICTQFGIPAKDASACYAKFASKPIDKEHFSKLWLQYMTSNNQSDPGNYIFGKTHW